MKKMMFIAAAMIMSLAMVMPAQAQSRKEKKAAAKANWELEQAQQREEAVLRHQMKMDSLQNAQKVAEEKAQRAEQERLAAEAEAKARKEKAERAAAMQEVEFNEPCMDFESTAEVIRARGIGEDLEQQMSIEMARSAAIEELGSQISTCVQSLMTNYKKSTRQGNKRESMRRVEGMTQTAVDQTTGFRVACRKTMTYIQDDERIFKTYMVVELGADQLLKPLYDQIQKDEELKLEESYQTFKNDFNEHFQKNDAALAE